MCSHGQQHGGSRETTKMAKKIITLGTINPLLIEMKNDELEPVVRRAVEIERELKKGIVKPFTDVIRADINDIQAHGQKPITFTRQVLTTCAYPLLLNDPFVPSDVRTRANCILDECGGRSAGAYTYSEGIDLIRSHIAEYLEKRDGFPAQKDDVVLTSGANEALRSILNILNTPHNGNKIGVLVPVPRDASFTAILKEFGIIQIDYFLEEEQGWSINMNELSTAIEAASRYCIPKAILVINPGNPTGSVLSSKNMEEIVEFSLRKKLVLLADEAYQFNALGQGQKFHSFKKIMMQMGSPFSSLEFANVMSGSTGILGECGLRIGCCEMVNFRSEVVDVYRKSICVKMCPSVMGQIALDCTVCPPQPEEPSYEKFIQERHAIMQSLNEKAKIMINSLNTTDGIYCEEYTAATFVFPKIYIPEKAITIAKILGQYPDSYYSLQLLEETGICSLPGNLYGQLPGTFHLRLTILPEKEKIKKMAEMIKRFHTYFIEKYK